MPVISPPPTAAAVIDIPTFVAVGNWPGVIGPLPSCDGPVCIELTAVPRLVFTPGDGTDPMTCAGAGTVFDPSPAAPEPDVQAEGACAHVYDERTAGRPWPGSLAIHWEVIWTSLTPDDDGVIDVIPQGVPVPRLVDEVHGNRRRPRIGSDERLSDGNGRRARCAAAAPAASRGWGGGDDPRGAAARTRSRTSRRAGRSAVRG